jgi:hypothetical protein
MNLTANAELPEDATPQVALFRRVDFGRLKLEATLPGNAFRCSSHIPKISRYGQRFPRRLGIWGALEQLNHRFPRLVYNRVLKINHQMWVGGVHSGRCFLPPLLNGNDSRMSSFAFISVFGWGLILAHPELPKYFSIDELRAAIARGVIRRWGRITVRFDPDKCPHTQPKKPNR